MATERIATTGANTACMEGEQPLCCSRDFLRGIGASQENRAEQLAFRPGQEEEVILWLVGQRLRNDEAARPQSMAPEFPQGLVHRSTLILPVDLAEQPPALGRDPTLAAHGQVKLKTAPLPRQQTAEVGTAVEQLRIGADPPRQQARQRRGQLRWLTQQCEARQGRVHGKLARVQRYVCRVSQENVRIHRDLRFFRWPLAPGHEGLHPASPRLFREPAYQYHASHAPRRSLPSEKASVC